MKVFFVHSFFLITVLSEDPRCVNLPDGPRSQFSTNLDLFLISCTLINAAVIVETVHEVVIARAWSFIVSLVFDKDFKLCERKPIMASAIDKSRGD